MTDDDPNLYLRSIPGKLQPMHCLWCKQIFAAHHEKNFCTILCHQAWLKKWTEALQAHNNFEITF